MNHRLGLVSIDTTDRNILKLIDASIYEESMPVEDAILEVKVPGFIEPAIIEVEQGFNLTLNACALGVQTDHCDSYDCPLPDGIYAIRYSVSPNDQVNVEYNYLKVSELMKKYREELCCVDLNAYEPSTEIKEKLKLLQEVRMYIDAAKIKAEICHEPKKSMELYEYAKKKLSIFDCGSHLK